MGKWQWKKTTTVNWKTSKNINKKNGNSKFGNLRIR